MAKFNYPVGSGGKPEPKKQMHEEPDADDMGGMDAGQEDPEMVAMEHGPAIEHHVHTVHGDGHEHHSVHGSPEEAADAHHKLAGKSEGSAAAEFAGAR